MLFLEQFHILKKCAKQILTLTKMDNCGRLEPIQQALKDQVREFRSFLDTTQETVRAHLGKESLEPVWFHWWSEGKEILEDYIVNTVFVFDIMDKSLRSLDEFRSFVRQNSIVEVSRKVEESLTRIRLVLDCLSLFEGGNLRSFFSDDVVRYSEVLVDIYTMDLLPRKVTNLQNVEYVETY